MEIEINDLKIHYIEEGKDTKTSILLLHGWGASIKSFKPVINELSKYYKVYAIDFPGFGESEDPNKNYYRKTPVLNIHEKKFFHIMRKKIGDKFIITPQVNLQSIIETDSYERNDELFRNIDFGIFDTEMYNPIMLIEVNGKQHENDLYWKKRDNSVKEILEKSNILFYTISNEEFKNNTKRIADEILEIIYKMENVVYY